MRPNTDELQAQITSNYAITSETEPTGENTDLFGSLKACLEVTVPHFPHSTHPLSNRNQLMDLLCSSLLDEKSIRTNLGE